MKFDLPSTAMLKEIGAELGFPLDDEYAEQVRTFMEPFGEDFSALDEVADDLPTAKYPRQPWYKPTGEENKHGAWAVKTSVKGAGSGRLLGKTVALKDTVCLADAPMINGASVLEGYIPDMDATIVTRLLDEGAEILGKAVCEYFSLSGGSYTSASGIVHSPRNPGHTPGGSSTGSAALVAAGDVDMAVGGDQAGSIRIPASFSGVVGIKPTHGLVPYTGIMGIEATIDHTGPMTRDVASNALFLEVMAGEDGLDPRQRVPADYRCTQLLDKGASGLKIAVVQEGFGRRDAEPDVDAGVKAAAQRLETLGANVREVSIPMHKVGVPTWGAIGLAGMYHTMLRGHGFGHNMSGVYPTSLVDTMGQIAGREQEFPDTFRFGLLFARYIDRQYGDHFYAKAQNVRRQLRAAYDQVLADYDVLLMPTTPMKTSKIPEPGSSFSTVMKHCWEMLDNTAPFDASGHPALSLPCGLGEGERPIGLMLIGKHFDEATVYQAAQAFEQSGDWQTMERENTGQAATHSLLTLCQTVV